MKTTKKITVYLTNEQYKEIEINAKETGMSKGVYLRYLALTSKNR
ncbi:plasmid mobilization protein [Mycoplasma feriruminatoris]|nr:hypothetical protein [Mycoplasma feriruminatoris]WFQ94775.1 hypothetical protein MFERI15220_00858 [Mycoplasma feriruminatoris]